MSRIPKFNTSPQTAKSHGRIPIVPWHPVLGLLFIFFLYYVSQFIGGAAVSIYPIIKHWTTAQANDWLSSSVTAQFVYILIAEATAIGAIYLFLKRYRTKLSIIGLRKPRWSDLGYGLLAVIPYYALYLIAQSVISHFVPSLNVNQAQEIGFTNVNGTLPLVLTFISLVVLPPITEEIMVRGFLYSSLRKAMPLIYAALLTSFAFAIAHLPEGGASGPLYIAAIDTFVLSMVLIWLREKTGGLWASITLHAIKNGIAFVALFILHLA